MSPFPAVLTQARDSLRGVETAVLVFPTWVDNDPERLMSSIHGLVERIPTVVAVPVVLDARASRDVLEEAAIDGLVQRLRAAGAIVRPWSPGQPLEAALGAEPAEVGPR